MSKKPTGYALVYYNPTENYGSGFMVKEVHPTKQEADRRWLYAGGFVLPVYDPVETATR
jgi:hypothetical protein